MGVGAGLYMYDVIVKKFTFAISSPDEFLSRYARGQTDRRTYRHAHRNSSHPHRGRGNKPETQPHPRCSLCYAGVKRVHAC